MSSRCADARGDRRNRGVALITVLLVFVLATMMAAAMLRSSYLAMRRTGNLVDSVQSRYYALGAEELGRQMLRDDGRAAPGGAGTDHLREAWAAQNIAFDIDDGALELRIEDLAGRFNLNSLVDESGKSDPVAAARLGRLLRQLGLDPQLAEAVADWIDADERTVRGGSESSAWGQRMPNQLLVSADELRVLSGFDEEVWGKLQPFVTALPRDVRLNINTASAVVLSAYAKLPVMAEMERFVLSRDGKPLRDVNDPSLATLFAESRLAMDVRSAYFELQVHAVYRDRHARLTTQVRRDAKSGKVQVTGRSDAARI